MVYSEKQARKIDSSLSTKFLVVLEKLLQYRKRFDKEIKEQIIWPKVSRLIAKYEPFINADMSRCKKILKEQAWEMRNE